jgi:putative transposase
LQAIFHSLLALIASTADRQLARYVEFLKAENKILRAWIKGQVHTKPDERRRLLQLGKALGQAIEEQITIVTPATFYRWITRSSNCLLERHSLPEARSS